MNKPTVKVKFSKGFGNNLFQYCFGKLLSEYHDANYSHDAIPEIGIEKKIIAFNKLFPTIKFKAKSNLEAKKYDRDYLKWFSKEYHNYNFDFYSFIFYYEDYLIYKPYLEKIRTWFPVVKKTNYGDLVIHFRLKNRLVWETHYKNFVKPESYKNNILNNFKFNKLYIVSDMDKWDYYTKKDIEKIKDNISIEYKGNPTGFIDTKKSLNYINELIDALKEFNPILHHSNKLIDDFNFIRSFDKIMFKNSTFSWWAATLSHASKIGVFGPWKPGKGKGKNRNLGKTDYNGWFSWGIENDLLNNGVFNN